MKQLNPVSRAITDSYKQPLMPRIHGNVFLRFLYCLLFSRESRTTSSLLETIQKRREKFPCIRDLSIGYYFSVSNSDRLYTDGHVKIRGFNKSFYKNEILSDRFIL